MSDTGTFLVNVVLKADASDVRKEISDLARLAETTSSTPAATVAASVARAQQAIDVTKERAQASASTDAERVKAGRLAGKQSTALTTAIRQYLAGVDEDFARELKAFGIGGKSGRTRLLKQEIPGLSLEESLALGPTNAKSLQEARGRTANLRSGGESDVFVRGLVEMDTEVKRFRAIMEQARRRTGDYIEAAVKAATAEKEMAARVTAGARATEEYVIAANLLSQSSKLLRERMILMGAGMTFDEIADLDPEQRRSLAAQEARRRRTREAVTDTTTAAVTPEEVSEIRQLDDARRGLRIAMLKEQDALEVSAKAIRDEAKLRRDRASLIAAERGGVTPEELARLGPTAAGELGRGRERDRTRLAVAGARTVDDEKLAAESQAVLARLNRARSKEAARLEFQALEEAGEVGFRDRTRFRASGGTVVPRSASLMDEFRGRLLTSAEFGVGGMVVGTALSEIGNIIKEASELEGTFVRLQGQLRQLGQEDALGPLREQIRGISTDTGVGAAEVAEFTSRILAVFPERGPDYAAEQASAAMKLMVVAGVDMDTMLKSVIPTARAFNVEVEELGNVAVEAGERLGISEEQVIDFLGKSATVAKEAGFNMQELAAIATTMGQVLGKDLGASADVFNKMPALIRRNSEEIGELLASTPDTAKFAQQFQQSLENQDIKGAFQSILQAASTGALGAGGQAQLTGLIANPREAEEATAILTQAEAILRRMGEAAAGAGAGSSALEDRFKRIQGTVSVALERIRQAVTGIGEALIALGLGDTFATLAASVGVAFAAIQKLLDLLRAVDEALSIGDVGLVSTMVQLGTVLAVVAKVLPFINQTIIQGTINSIAATRAKLAEATARVRNTLAARGEAVAVATSTAAGRAGQAGVAANLLAGTRGPLAAAASGTAAAGGAAAGGGALAALGVTGPAIAFTVAIVGATVALQKLAEAGDDVTQRSQATQDQLRKASDAELAAVSDSTLSAWDGIVSRLFKIPTPIEQRDVEQGRRAVARTSVRAEASGRVPRADDLIDERVQTMDVNNLNKLFGYPKYESIAKKLGLVRGFNTSGGYSRYTIEPGQIDELYDYVVGEIDSGDPNRITPEITKLAEMFDEFFRQPGNADLQTLLADEIDRVVRDRAVGEDKDKGLDPTDRIKQDFEALREDLAIKRIAPAEYIQRAQLLIAQHTQGLPAGVDDPTLPAAVKQVLLEEQDAINKILADHFTRRMDLLSTLIRGSGTRTPESDIAARMESEVAQLPVALQIEQLPALLEQYKKKFEEELNAITDPVERARAALRGFPLPRSYRVLQSTAMIQADMGSYQVATQVADTLSMGVETTIRTLAEMMADHNLTLQQAIMRLVMERRQALIDELLAKSPYANQRTPGFEQLDPRIVAMDRVIMDSLALMDPKLPQILVGASGFFAKSAEGLAADVSKRMAVTHESFKDAFVAILKERQKVYLDLLASVGLTPAEQDQLNILNGLIVGAEGLAGTDAVGAPPSTYTETGTGTDNSTVQSNLQKAAEEQKAKIRARVAGVPGNAMARAVNELDQAYVDYALQEQLAAAGFPDPAARQDALNRIADAKANVRQQAQERELALMDWAVINAAGDPVAENAAQLAKAYRAVDFAIENAGGDMGAVEVTRAQQEVARLLQQRAEALQSGAANLFAVPLAQAARDPLRTAQLQLDQAKQAEAAAVTEAQRLDAMAERITAEHRLEDAINAGFEARANLAIALANANGNIVEAARLAAVEAQRKLDVALGQGITDDAVLGPLRAGVIESNANLRRTSLSQQESIIDFQKEMGQITTDVAIAQLRLLLQQTQEGTDDYRRLALKIHQLETEASGGAGGLQFNLPTTLGLPTLYEARRMNQSIAQGIGYQDNRNISMIVQVNGATDPLAVAAQVMNAFQAAAGSANVYSGGVVGVP